MLVVKTFIVLNDLMNGRRCKMKQFLITPSAGKRLIAITIANHPAIKKALKNGTVVIVAGTTNGYVAEEILKTYKIANDFSRKHFFRGITMPPTKKVTVEGRIADESNVSWRCSNN